MPRSAARIDDRLHPLLSKARPLSQCGLEPFLEEESRRAGAAALLPPSVYGRYEVREVDVRSALTRCRLPGEPWSLNPYVGCSHACAYCYVPDVAHVERPRWGSYVLVKRNLPTVLSRELRRKERKEVFLSSATDPYQPAESEHQVTRRALHALRRSDWPLRVLTRNPLVRRDVDLLGQFSDLRVGMSVPTLDDGLRRQIEPGAPNVEGRLRALRALADAGLDTFANLAPAYPLTGGVRPQDVARAFRDAGVGVVYAGAWRYLATVLPVLRERLDAEAAASFLAAIEAPAYFERLFRSLAGALRREGVEFVVMQG